ncbi:voltage-gated potassium channel KCNC1-like [Engystomops pustulosus]|uniref:voltage-gated potassium channel KCNC1-like n=1 Tax=Engystomops pustulosus TaxID=76066 RepID=UPI003AFB1427
MDTPDRRVVINVGGVRFETYARTLQSFPGTKLASLAMPDPGDSMDYDPQQNEFFFDRNPKVFGYILDYYRTKHLHCSDNMCRSVLMEELSFWEISYLQLSHCCWLKINTKSRDLEDFMSWEGTAENEKKNQLGQTGNIDYSWRGRWQPKVWPLFDKPFSSLASKCVSAISLLFIIGAIVIFFEEARVHSAIMNQSVPSYDYVLHSVPQELNLKKASYLPYLELLCVFWFISEFCIRLIFCPDRKEFIKNPLNWVDFLSLFPVFIELMSQGQHQQIEILWKVLGFLRLLYILKLFRFLLHVEGSLVLRVLSGTLKDISREIFVFLLILGIETLFFANLAFYAEWSGSSVQDELFLDIYDCCWWAIVTLTTVGYGDIIPRNTAGRIVCSMAAISGVLTIVLPIPILVLKFHHYYSIALAKERMKIHRSQ